MKHVYDHGSATHVTLVDKFAGHTESSQQNTVHNMCAKVSLSQIAASGLRKGHGVFRRTATILCLNLSLFRKRKMIDLISVVD